jgi:hypothetical protein
VETQIEIFQRGTVLATRLETIPMKFGKKKKKKAAFFPCSKNLPDGKFKGNGLIQWAEDIS